MTLLCFYDRNYSIAFDFKQTFDNVFDIFMILPIFLSIFNNYGFSLIFFGDTISFNMYHKFSVGFKSGEFPANPASIVIHKCKGTILV